MPVGSGRPTTTWAAEHRPGRAAMRGDGLENRFTEPMEAERRNRRLRRAGPGMDGSALRTLVRMVRAGKTGSLRAVAIRAASISRCGSIRQSCSSALSRRAIRRPGINSLATRRRDIKRRATRHLGISSLAIRRRATPAPAIRPRGIAAEAVAEDRGALRAGAVGPAVVVEAAVATPAVAAVTAADTAKPQHQRDRFLPSGPRSSSQRFGPSFGYLGELT